MKRILPEGRPMFAACTHGSVIDISNAFYHIDLATVSQPYLGFGWFEKFFRYCFLPPMEISSAPAIFSKVTFPMASSWRARGIWVLKYLDDLPNGQNPN
jgi:hypothetical protein